MDNLLRGCSLVMAVAGAMVSCGCATSDGSRAARADYPGIKNLPVHTILHIQDKGRRVILEDGSIWRISPHMVTKTAAWQPGLKVTIGDRGSVARYAYYLLVNRDGEVGRSVDAEFVGFEMNTAQEGLLRE